MKKLLLLLCLALPSFGQSCAGTWTNGYTYCRPITINAAQITGTLTNFIFTVSGTKTYLATVANGGLLQSASGFDNIFTSDSAGTTKLNWDTVLWTNMGVVEYKISIPSAAVGTTIYEFYGNAAIVTDQSAGTATYDANFVAVWPFPDGTTLSLVDRTSNGNTPTNIGATAQTGGEFDGAFGTLANGQQAKMGSDAASLKITGNITTECWAKFTTSQGNRPFISKWGTTKEYLFGVDFTTNNRIIMDIAVGTVGKTAVTTSTFNDGAWHHAAGVWNGTNVLIYVDGVVTTGTATAGPIDDHTDPVTLSNYNTGGIGTFVGTLDDCRISNVARSAAWIAATFNNGNQAAFSTTGAQQTSGGSTFVSNPTIITVGP